MVMLIRTRVPWFVGEQIHPAHDVGFDDAGVIVHAPLLFAECTGQVERDPLRRDFGRTFPHGQTVPVPLPDDGPVGPVLHEDEYDILVGLHDIR